MDQHQPGAEPPEPASSAHTTATFDGEAVLDAVHVHTFTADPIELYRNERTTIRWEIQRPPGPGVNLRFFIRDDQTGNLLGLTADSGSRAIQPPGLGRFQYSLWGQIGPVSGQVGAERGRLYLTVLPLRNPAGET
jgi:hypothetical protein